MPSVKQPLGQRVAIEINRAEAEGLFERGKQAQQQGRRKGGYARHGISLMTNSSSSTPTRKIIAQRANVGEELVQKLITVKRKRPDLFQRVFEGWYDENGREVTINTVYRMMKLEEKGWARHGLERPKIAF